jgi:subtilisin family serine protease
MDPLELVRLSSLMRHSQGRREVRIGLIDGPVATELGAFADAAVKVLGGDASIAGAAEAACTHGTFIASMLVARTGFGAPAICPGCTLLVHPIFSMGDTLAAGQPSAAPELLASAIVRCIEAGARVINLSLALAQSSMWPENALEQALDRAMRQQVIVVAAAGNQSTVGSTAITRHPWVVPVVACDASGRPIPESNLGRSIARGGVRAPGEGITGVGPEGRVMTFRGTSVAVPFVTGAAALLISAFPGLSGARVRAALTGSKERQQTTSLLPPVLDATAAYLELVASIAKRGDIQRERAVLNITSQANR